MKYAFEQLTEPGERERPSPYKLRTCMVKQNAKLENESADEPTQVEGRTDATLGGLAHMTSVKFCCQFSQSSYLSILTMSNFPPTWTRTSFRETPFHVVTVYLRRSSPVLPNVGLSPSYVGGARPHL